MRDLVLGMLALLVITVTITFGARAVGRAQLDPGLLNALHFTDCALPCWAGIVVGTTTHEEAVQRLTDLFSAQAAYVLPVGDSELVIHVDAGSHGTLDVLMHTSHDVITAMILDTQTVDGLLYTDLLALSGTPSCAAYAIAVYQTRQTYAVVHGIRGRYGRVIESVHSIRLYRYSDVARFLPSACR